MTDSAGQGSVSGVGRLGIEEPVGWLWPSYAGLTWHQELSQAPHPLSSRTHFSFRISLSIQLAEGCDNDDEADGHPDPLATGKVHNSAHTSAKDEEWKSLEGRTGWRGFRRAGFGPEPLREYQCGLGQHERWTRLRPLPSCDLIS